MGKTKEEILFETNKVAYENACQLHRYFLSWRHQLFAGYLAVLAALAIAFNWAYKNPLDYNSRLWLVIVIVIGVFLTIIFWLLEIRTRQLYRGCQNIARNLEIKMGIAPAEESIKNCGVFYELLRMTKDSSSHSRIMNIFFSITLITLVLLALTVIFILK